MKPWSSYLIIKDDFNIKTWTKNIIESVSITDKLFYRWNLYWPTNMVITPGIVELCFKSFDHRQLMSKFTMRFSNFHDDKDINNTCGIKISNAQVAWHSKCNVHYSSSYSYFLSKSKNSSIICYKNVFLFNSTSNNNGVNENSWKLREFEDWATQFNN